MVLPRVLVDRAVPGEDLLVHEEGVVPAEVDAAEDAEVPVRLGERTRSLREALPLRVDEGVLGAVRDVPVLEVDHADERAELGAPHPRPGPVRGGDAVAPAGGPHPHDPPVLAAVREDDRLRLEDERLPVEEAEADRADDPPAVGQEVDEGDLVHELHAERLGVLRVVDHEVESTVVTFHGIIGCALNGASLPKTFAPQRSTSTRMSRVEFRVLAEEVLVVQVVPQLPRVVLDVRLLSPPRG